MSDNVFTRKIGPLPGWGWAGGAIAAIAIAQRLQSKKSSSTVGTAQGATSSGQAGTVGTGASVNYAPQTPYSYGGNYVPTNANLETESLLSILAAQGAASPSPGNASTGDAVSPGNTGNPALQPVDSSKYPVLGAPGEQFTVLGSFTGPSQLSAYNVGGGVPVYAYLNDKWQQDFNSATVPVGTQIGIPSSFDSYINRAGGVVTGKI